MDFWLWEQITQDWELIESLKLSVKRIFIYDRQSPAQRFDTFFKTLWPINLVQPALKLKHYEISDIRGSDFIQLWFLVYDSTCVLKDVRPSIHDTMSQSRAMGSQRPKFGASGTEELSFQDEYPLARWKSATFLCGR